MRLKLLLSAAGLSILMAMSTPAATISDYDGTVLCKIAQAEAGDQGTKGMALVMRVVLNRVASKEWPNTVEGVVMQSGQFTPVSNGQYSRAKPSSQCYEALEWVRNGWDESGGAIYFCMTGSSKWHDRNLTRLFSYKDHTFYR